MIIAKKLITDSTDSNGQVNYRYDSTGIGDVIFGATFHDENSSDIRLEEDSSFLNKIYVRDYIYTNLADINKVSDFGSVIFTRGNGNGSITYNDEKYVITSNNGSSQIFIPLTPIAGLNNFQIEFDALGYTQNNQTFGFQVYNDSNNWIDVPFLGNAGCWVHKKINGVYSETSEGWDNPSSWAHVICKIENGTLNIIANSNDIEYFNKTENIPFTLSNLTQFGFALGYNANNVSHIKNIIVY